MDDYQYQNDGYVETPQDYKIWSIINIVLGVLCCCNCGFVSIIMGILALMKSNEVEKNIQMGEQGIMLAQEASSKAKTYNIVASAFIVLSIIVGFIVFIINIANS